MNDPRLKRPCLKKMANITTEHVLITIHFLEKLRVEHRDTEALSPMHRAFEHLLSHHELLEILQRMHHGGTAPNISELKTKSKSELLSLIDDEYYILEYVIEEVWGSHVL